MGTKRQIADRVAEVLDRAPPGPCLDLFAGMSAVGRATSDCRNVWCNDVQHFAAATARSFFTAKRGTKDVVAVLPEIHRLFLRNRSALRRKYDAELKAEAAALSTGKLELMLETARTQTTYCISEEATALRTKYSENVTHFPKCLFTISYSGGFVGLQQAIDIDSIRYAVDSAREDNKINPESHEWCVIVLCHALANISNSTGHFAQYLALKEKTRVRYINKRVRDVWTIWRASLAKAQPFGTRQWRNGNKVFRTEAIQLLNDLRLLEIRPAVIYADPPYTTDHYSRYYHLWETLVLYDYPSLTSKGLYRADRFYSPFSIKTQAHSAFESLIESAARLKSTFVLSYPENGIFGDSTNVIKSILRCNFRHADLVVEIDHEHSSLGGSKGREKAPVTERIFYAHN